MRILIVEDDVEIAQLVKAMLERNNYVVDWQETTEGAIEAISMASFDAIILDRSLPDGDGMTLLCFIKLSFPQEDRPPVIILSAMDGPQHRVEGLEAGAVDYVVKPYEPAELLARLKICLQFKTGRTNPVIKIGNIEYDKVDQRLSIHGRTLTLPRRELVIFDTLVRSFGSVVPHEKLYNAIYSYEDQIESNSAASHISKLRKKLQDENSGIDLKVMRHIGYYLKEA